MYTKVREDFEEKLSRGRYNKKSVLTRARLCFLKRRASLCLFEFAGSVDARMSTTAASPIRSRIHLWEYPPPRPVSRPPLVLVRPGCRPAPITKRELDAAGLKASWFSFWADALAGWRYRTAVGVEQRILLGLPVVSFSPKVVGVLVADRRNDAPVFLFETCSNLARLLLTLFVVSSAPLYLDPQVFGLTGDCILNTLRAMGLVTVIFKRRVFFYSGWGICNTMLVVDNAYKCKPSPTVGFRVFATLMCTW